MSSLTFEHLLVPLPDVEGCVHGIVSLDPPRVQCDGCGLVATGEGMSLGLLIILAQFLFDPYRYGHGDDRRRCADCRKASP